MALLDDVGRDGLLSRCSRRLLPWGVPEVEARGECEREGSRALEGRRVCERCRPSARAALDRPALAEPPSETSSQVDLSSDVRTFSSDNAVPILLAFVCQRGLREWSQLSREE